MSRRAWDVLASVVTNAGISCQKVGLAGQGSSHVVTQPRSRATRLTDKRAGQTAVDFKDSDSSQPVLKVSHHQWRFSIFTSPRCP